jgi:hypothetical protein
MSASTNTFSNAQFRMNQTRCPMWVKNGPGDSNARLPKSPRKPTSAGYCSGSLMPNRAAVEDRWSVVKRVFNEDATRSHNLDRKIFRWSMFGVRAGLLGGGSTPSIGRLTMVGMRCAPATQ